MMLRAEPARAHDLRGALELLGRAELTEQDVGEGWGHYFVVREDDGRVVGVAGLELHGEDGLLRSVAVDEDYRGQGLAGALSRPCSSARSAWACARCTCSRPARGTTSRAAASGDCARDAAPPAIRESWEFKNGCPSTAAFMQRKVG